MSNEQTPVESVDDDLDAFSATFFESPASDKQEVDVVEPASPTEEEIIPVEDDANKTHDGEDTPADEDEDQVGDEAEPQPKPKKNRFQERIDELTGKAREAERERDAVLARLEKLEQNAQPTPAVKATEDTGPSPDDTNEDGTEKYPLGEFDPHYIRDLTRHTLQEERNALLAKDAEESQQREMDTQRAELQADWESKLGPAQERYPDFQEKGQSLISTFDGIEPAYGEYLTSTLMSLEYGPDVLYYLANNVDEAQKIVNSGAAKATVALGRLEAKFAFANEEKQKARPKVSQAPVPPAHVNKGSAVSVPEVPDDTDDLDAFSAKLFKKRRG